MNTSKVTVFRPFEFQVGQKIYIDGGGRHGDWEVIGVNENKVRLRCPISKKEFDWVNFCYFVEDREDQPWPQPDK